jgi:hypothetical protein
LIDVRVWILAQRAIRSGAGKPAVAESNHPVSRERAGFFCACITGQQLMARAANMIGVKPVQAWSGDDACLQIPVLRLVSGHHHHRAVDEVSHAANAIT